MKQRSSHGDAVRIVLLAATAVTLVVIAAGLDGYAWVSPTSERVDRKADLEKPPPLDNGFQQTVLPAEAVAPTLMPDAGWTSFAWHGTGLVFNDEGPFVFEAQTPVTLRVTDDFCAGDRFRVYDFGVELRVDGPLGPVTARETFQVDPVGWWGIGPDAAFRANWMSSGIYQLAAGPHSIQVQVIENPWRMGRAYLRIDTGHPMQTFDLEAVASSYNQIHGQDRFWFAADIQPSPGSDGMFPGFEEIVLWYGRYLEVLPAGSLVCDPTECTYDSDDPGIQHVEITDDTVLIRADLVDLCPGGNPHFIGLWIGNDGASIPVRCKGTLRIGE